MTRPLYRYSTLAVLATFVAGSLAAQPASITTWAHEPGGDEAYAVSGDCTMAPLLHRLDGASGAQRVVGAILDLRCVTSIGFDGDGRLLAYDALHDALFEIDRTTAAARRPHSIGAGVFWHSRANSGPAPADVGGVLTLDVSGPCPGIITIVVGGASPGDRVALFDSPETGQAFLPPGTVCPGTEIGVLPPLELLSLFTIPDSGVLTVNHDAPAESCQLIMQSLNGNTCETSNLEPVSEP